ncbi:hypothetical protein GQ457_07G009660 [Hibiscus cannabinus]
MAFFDFVWSIWLCRNEIVLKRKNWEVNLIFDLAGKRIHPAQGAWIKPPLGFLKFNVDASVIGSYGEAGAGDILRNHEGYIFFKFSAFLCLCDLKGVELKAVRKACSLFSTSKWLSQFSLVVESDCQLVEDVSWFKNFLANIFKKVVFDYIEVNEEAHILAKQGVIRVTDFIWGIE